MAEASVTLRTMGSLGLGTATRIIQPVAHQHLRSVNLPIFLLGWVGSLLTCPSFSPQLAAASSPLWWA